MANKVYTWQFINGKLQNAVLGLIKFDDVSFSCSHQSLRQCVLLVLCTPGIHQLNKRVRYDVKLDLLETAVTGDIRDIDLALTLHRIALVT